MAMQAGGAQTSPTSAGSSSSTVSDDHHGHAHHEHHNRHDHHGHHERHKDRQHERQHLHRLSSGLKGLLIGSPAEGVAAPVRQRVGSFPEQQQFWRGGDFLFLGSGIRYHRLGWFDIKVYEGGLFMEEATAAAELRRLDGEGFFAGGDYGTDRMCSALAACNSTAVLQLKLLRSITGKQFTDALSKSLEPRVAGTADEKLFPGFIQYFAERQLNNDANVPIMWSSAAALEVALLPPGDEHFADAKPDCEVASQSFAAAVYDIYLSDEGPLVGARDKWAEAARSLMGKSSASD